jgi:Fe-S oxidoreductase
MFLEQISEMEQQLREITGDPTAIPEAVTYHDSCNLARNGGLIEEPRFVLRNVVSDFRAMRLPEHPIAEAPVLAA